MKEQFIKIVELLQRKVNHDDVPILANRIYDIISEGYVEKAKYDEAVRQRDELKQKLSEIFAICEDGQELNTSNYNHDDVSALNQTFVEIYIAVEAAIKNTEG